MHVRRHLAESLGFGRTLLAIAWLAVIVAASGCSVKKYAVNKVGDVLASGDSVYESEADYLLAGDALPFGLKLTESLLVESPRHRGLLLSACRGFVLYAYGYVHFEAEKTAFTDIALSRRQRQRASALYLRATAFGLRALEVSYPGFTAELSRAPVEAASIFQRKDRDRDLPLLYWTAASLGLAISASKNDSAMLARLPEVEALLDRALLLDESWHEGALHEFQIMLAGVRPGRTDFDVITEHYQRALELSRGTRAGLFLAYAEAKAVPSQDRIAFRSLIEKAMAVDLAAVPNNRLMNVLSRRRAEWLMGRIDELFLDDQMSETTEGRRSLEEKR